MDTQPIGYEDRGTSADDGFDADGMEVPPAIGQDERRMHVRAYNFWAKLLEGRSFPSIESLDIQSLEDFGGHAVLLDFTSGIDNPAIVYVGSAIAREGELPDEIEYINDVPRRSLLSRLTDHYLQIIANRAPVGFEAEFVNSRDATILYRGVLLPFSSDDDTIDFILGVINWKEAAAGSLNAALADELAAELAAPPVRPTLPPTMPVWGDGPASQDQSGAMPHRMPIDLGDPFVEDDLGPLLDDRVDPFVGDPFIAEDAAPADLADWLASARGWADAAHDARGRSHHALYRAISRARGFAIAAAHDPLGYAELLAEAGLRPSRRAPLTALTKLVFGPTYDKTRLAECSAVLNYAEAEAIDPDALMTRLEQESGGLKGLVRTARAAARAARGELADRPDALERARTIAARSPAMLVVSLPDMAGDGPFVSLLARREMDGSLSILGGTSGDDPATRHLLKALAASAPHAAT